MKIEVVNTEYPIKVPNGSIMTVVEDLGDGCVGATKDGGDDFEWFMLSDTYRVIPALTIEAGKFYRTRDGRKGYVTGSVDEDGDWEVKFEGSPARLYKEDGTHGGYTHHIRNKPRLDLIAEWTEDDDMNEICDERKDGPFVKIDLVEIGALAELNVKPGDVVECVELSTMANGHYLTVGKHYEINDDLKFIDDEGDPCSGHNNKFRIISRASDTFKGDYSFMSSDVCLPDGNDPYLFGDGDPVSASDTPKTWGEMTDTEKGELLLDWNDNHARNVQQWNGSEWIGMQTGRFGRVTAYRIKPQPQRETVTLYGAPSKHVQWCLDQCGLDTHRITFDTIDGTPDLASIKMERV